MQIIGSISESSNQLIKPRLEDGSIINLELKYFPAIQRWIINVTHETFTVNGINLCSSFNILRQWKNVIPFGIACLTIDTADPIFIDDFISGRASIFILNEEEIQLFEDYVYGTET